MSERIVIVGAGINGLVAANYLQRQGYQVSLIDLEAIILSDLFIPFGK